MILPGHVAAALFAHKFLRAELPTVLAASLVPDLVDKGLAQVLRVTPSGRYFMHSLTGWALSTLLVALFLGRKRGYAWAIGHLAHLFGDPGFLPWFFPFQHYNFAMKELEQFLYDSLFSAKALRSAIFELGLLVLALANLYVDRLPPEGATPKKQRTPVVRVEASHAEIPGD